MNLLAISSKLILIGLLISSTAFGQDKAAAPKEPASEKAEKKEPASTNNSAAKPSSEKKASEKSSEAEKKTAKPKIQVVRPSGIYLDYNEPLGLDPSLFLFGDTPVKQKSFFKLCEFLQNLAKDDSISTVLLDLSDPALYLNGPQVSELGRKLSQLRSKKKKLIAWLENASSFQLALASQCDEVLLTELGGIDLASTTMETAYFRDAMDLFGIKASIVRAGDFKGAVEPYMISQMSQHLKDHYLAMLASMNDARVATIAKGRGLTVAKVRELQGRRFLLPKEALAADLVDRLADYGSLKKTVESILGHEPDWIEPAQKTTKEMSFFEFVGAAMAGPKGTSNRIKDPSLVVLHLSGVIVDGSSPSPGMMMSGPMVEQIGKLTNDERVKGVVIRINSPGGSATASEAIRQALIQLAAKKPCLVSMGEMAASGGYWISCLGVPVYAEPETLTGSIGVFSFKLSFGTLFRRIGVQMETLALDESAAAFSMDRPWSDKDQTTLQSTVDNFYQRFLTIVSESRKLPVDKVDSLAGGRVWSGAQAKQSGLVDELGGVDDCLDVLAKKLKLEKFSTIHRPEPPTGFELLELLGEQDEDEILLKLMSSDGLKAIQRQGFRLQTLEAIVRQALQGTRQAFPHVWAIQPAELRIR
jgi:protease IV